MIDVSHHNKVIDWELVKTGSSVRYVYVKATEGATFQDSLCRLNIERARSRGLMVGAYHFFTMTSHPRDQFDNFLSVVAPDSIDLIPMVDVEAYQDKKGQHIGPFYAEDSLALKTVQNNLSQLLSIVDSCYGTTTMIYCNKSAYQSFLTEEMRSRPLYVGDYSASPFVDDYIVWQYSEHGRIRGIDTEVDLCKVSDPSILLLEKPSVWHLPRVSKARRYDLSLVTLCS